jgi:site-specific DNA-cytosine methylase
MVEDVYGILAAPPCTEFSRAKGASPRNFWAAMRVVSACMDVIWHCRTFGKLKFWAMENPVGFLRQFMGKPAYTFEQWQFGTSTVKATDLWGYFNAPKPTVKVRPERITTGIGHRGNGRDWSEPVVPDEYKSLNLDRSAKRAITPPGFAEAFFKANK